MLSEIRDLMLEYTGHISFNGRKLEVLVGDRIATVEVDPTLNLEDSYLWPIWLALQKAKLDGMIDKNAQFMKSLDVEYNQIKTSPNGDKHGSEVLQKLWFALDQHRNSIVIDSAKEIKQAMYKAASILMAGKVLEFEAET